jgi:hypothetical protein
MLFPKDSVTEWNAKPHKMEWIDGSVKLLFRKQKTLYFYQKYSSKHRLSNSYQ